MSQIQKYVPVMTRGRFLNQFKHLVKYEAEEPEAEYSANYFYELYVSSQVYHCLLNSAACEQSSRMNAMGNASNNAGDILAGLTLKYNQARQARITMELIEIISGANAL
jgi:F-type H+-transporting ATPase subunit gamma